MASSFFGLYVQRDAIQIAQKSLDITGHNISNINTEGYSRQRVDVVSVANTKGTLGYNTGVSLAGKGAEAIGVTQIRNKLLDAKVRKYSSELCDTGAKTSVLSDIEDILDDVENEKTGLAAILGNWKASFQSFSATGADRRDLSNIAMNSAQSVLNVMKNFETRIKDCETATGKDIENTNTRINSILKEMASLNKQIEDAYVQMNDVYATPGGYQAELLYGPLELKDKFNSLADELSQYMNITVTEQLEGSYTVEFGDNILVNKDSYAKTDIKFRPDFADKVKDADGNDISDKVLFLEKDPVYDSDGKVIETGADGNIPAGTKLYYSDGKDSGLTADGKGGYIDADGNAPVVYIVGKSKFYDGEGNEIKDWGTINDGATVKDENGNTIEVKGNFDAECIDYTFTEFYVSSHNTAREWEKSKRELTSEFVNAGMGDMINKINSLIESGDVEEALRYEEEIISAAAEKKVEYKPVFKEHITGPVVDGKIQYPSYAISVSDETDTLTGGSIKGLFDMYNGEGVYSGLTGNSYKGIKYYQETIRSLAKTLKTEFNALYDDYNNENPDDQFRIFEFNGAETVGNLKLAQTWKDDPLRCVHPEGTKDEDFNYDELDNVYLNKLLSAFEKKHDFSSETFGSEAKEDAKKYTFEEFVAFYGNTLGSQLEDELNVFDATTTQYESVASAREEVMGVQMDEEGVNMMNYQKWYNAISRMITAMDQCLDKLINGTGVVGL